MIDRALRSTLLSRARQYPIVTVTGPRQSGKTTLCRATFPRHRYVNLEDLNSRAFAVDDPRGFVASLVDGAIIDEVQRAPELMSALQVEVDLDASPGRFILTGSQHLGISAAIAQSLAGRTAVLTLHPPHLSELRGFVGRSYDDLLTVLWTGAYPRIHDHDIPADVWLGDYITTYVERDVRSLLNVGDLRDFSRFMRLCAGSTATELNLSRLASDVGITHPTAKAWLSVLEASFLCTFLDAHHANLRKRLVKRPKLHFLDSGLVCALLGIRTPTELTTHPLRGAIFESFVVSEVLKHHVHRGVRPRLSHYREARGLEVDLLVEQGSDLHLVEMKSGATVRSEHLQPAHALSALLESASGGKTIHRYLVHGGDTRQARSRTTVLPWSALDTAPWAA